MQLQDSGKLSIEDPLGKYVPQYMAARNISLRQLLLQTSGIPDYTDAPGFGRIIRRVGERYTIAPGGSFDSILGLIANQNVDFAAGTKWIYSNTNYILLGRIVEIVSHEPWQTYIRDHMFKPAAVTESSLMEDEAQIGNMATGYVYERGAIYHGAPAAGWARRSGKHCIDSRGSSEVGCGAICRQNRLGRVPQSNDDAFNVAIV